MTSLANSNPPVSAPSTPPVIVPYTCVAHDLEAPPPPRLQEPLMGLRKLVMIRACTESHGFSAVEKAAGAEIGVLPHRAYLAGGKALADTQQLGNLQDVQDEESSEGEDEDSKSMPSPSNNFNFPPDIVARFEEGYRSNRAAGMEAMRKTYVSHIRDELLKGPLPAASYKRLLLLRSCMPLSPHLCAAVATPLLPE